MLEQDFCNLGLKGIKVELIMEESYIYELCCFEDIYELCIFKNI